MTALESLLSDPGFAHAVMLAFGAMVALTVVHHVAIYTIPRRVIPYTALPWAFRFDLNLDLDFQTVTYAAVHDRLIARWSHLTLPFEQVAWAIVLLWVHPVALGLVLVAVTYQALRLGEPTLAIGLIAMWLAFAAIGAFALHASGVAAVVASMSLLLLGPVLRFLGHTFEPIPPFVGVPKDGPPRDAFIPLMKTRLGLALPFLVLGGTVSEFAAGFPHRLIIVQLSWLLQQFGFAPRQSSRWPEARVLGAAIRANGWKAYEKTRRLFAGESPASTTGSVVTDG